MADMDRRRILVVDDEERMVRFIRMNLEHDGFQVGEAFNGKQAIQKIRDFTPDLILLDVMMPDIDGFDVLETIRDFSNVPVIMLTAKGEEDDRVRGLEHGADDYITKPFSPRELVARVRTVLRRTQGDTSADMIRSGNLALDRGRFIVTIAEREVTLTPTEFEILATLASQPGRIFTRSQLLMAVRGVAFESYERAIDSHIRNLRKKLNSGGEEMDPIITVHGVGYKFSGT